jgi:hypothetical protein
MTSVVLRAHVPCALCGYLRPVLRFASVRVNAKSLREQPPTLVVGPLSCRECGWVEQGNCSYAISRFRLDQQDTAKVEAVRARRKVRA